MRSLATIQRIKSLEPIPGKDKIVYASFTGCGWRVIVGKDMEVGDLCVYVEPDALLPDKPEFAFLRSRGWMPSLQKYRIKTLKMANKISEGICFPLSILGKEIIYENNKPIGLRI
jgi:hypothetical protein